MRIVRKTCLLCLLVLIGILAACSKSSEGSRSQTAAQREADRAGAAAAAGSGSADLAGSETASGQAGTGAEGDASAASAEATTGSGLAGDGGDAGASGSSAQTDAGSGSGTQSADASQQAAQQAAEAARQAELRRIANLSVPDPQISEPSAVLTSPIQVSLSVNQREAVIYYTLDGSNPGRSAGTRYTGPFQVSATTTVRAVAFVVGGKISNIVEQDYAFNEIYVAQGGSGPGTRRRPAGSLESALQNAREKRIPIIKMAAGTYSASVEIDFPISISGSWTTDFSVRSTSPSIVNGLEVPRSTKQDPAYVFKYSGTAITDSVTLEFLELRGAEATYSTGLLIVNRAAPLVRNVQSLGGFGSYGYGAVVYGNAHPVFKASRLSGGSGATGYGLSLDAAQATVESSWLTAGTGTVGGYGATITDARLRAASSVFAGNRANTSYAVAFYNSSGSELENCSLIGGSGRDAAAVFSSVSNPSIVNCVLTAQGSNRSYGYLENFGNSAPARLRNNVFVGCEGALYYRMDNRQAYKAVNADGNLTLADGSVLPGNLARNNSLSTVMPGGEPDYRTPPQHGWPAAQVLSGAAAVDISGNTRSGAWTPGAWQQP